MTCLKCNLDTSGNHELGCPCKPTGSFMKIIKAPQELDIEGKSFFLAGSIEMGKAENWQQKVERLLSDYNLPISILNPRRDDWDSSWVQSIDNPRFREQVEWELNAMEQADCILMYFDPNTKSPITLLELGLWSHNWDRIMPEGKKLIVCCPDGFWRKGNVDIVCERYGVDQAEDIKSLVEYGIQFVVNPTLSQL